VFIEFVSIDACVNRSSAFPPATNSTYRGVSPAPYSPDLAIADFRLFNSSKQQLSGRSLDSEENVLEKIIEILGELPKDEVKNAFVYWKERC
jgi:hypothetical protein